MNMRNWEGTVAAGNRGHANLQALERMTKHSGWEQMQVRVFVGSGPKVDLEVCGGPTLHQQYTVDEAVAAFGSAGSPEFFCNRQFIVLDNAVLCMVTVGDPVMQSHVCAPSRVTWKPGGINSAPSDGQWCLPDKVIDIWTPDRKRAKEHHVFLRRPDDQRFFYAGGAHLGSYSASDANFSLYAKLPRDEWLRLGGYPGWLVEINHRTERVDNGHVDAFRLLTAEIAELECSHLSMTRFEEDVLTLFTNAFRGWLIYQRDPAGPGASGCDPRFAGACKSKEIFRCACGIELDISTDHTLPRTTAMQVAEEFFAVGELPQTVRWLSQ